MINSNTNIENINQTFGRVDHFMAGRIASMVLPNTLEVVRVEV